MPIFRERVDVYKPNHVNLADLNVVPTAATLVTLGMKCNIHRGTEESRADALAVGIVSNQTGNLYTEASNYRLLGDRYILVDGNGELWLLRERQILRNRFGPTKHVKCLITRLLQKPVGVP